MEVKIRGLEEIRNKCDLALGLMIVRSGCRDLENAVKEILARGVIRTSGSREGLRVDEQLTRASAILDGLLSGVMSGEIEII